MLRNPLLLGASALLLLAACTRPPAQHPNGIAGASTLRLKAVASIAAKPVEESSGLAASRRSPGLYWTHNDSGDGPRLYPLDASGQTWPGSPPEGILVCGAAAVDWEDLCFAASGQLVIADLGNNANQRRDLTVYLLPEPEPTQTTVAVTRSLRVAYPDQLEFPPAKLNFDCEAVVWFDGKLHLLTKHRADEATTLYRLDSQAPFPEANILTKLGTFPIGGQVTSAAVSSDGLSLAVLTYHSVWLFRRENTGDDFFAGRLSWLPIRAQQCEAICFEPGETVLRLTNEQRDIFRLPLADLQPIRP